MANEQTSPDSDLDDDLISQEGGDGETDQADDAGIGADEDDDEFDDSDEEDTEEEDDVDE